MLLGFKRRFAPFVQDGSKTHTIRAERKRPPRVGEMCHCYVDPRQKTMRLLGRFQCVKVEPIEIYERGDGAFGVVISGQELSRDEKSALAWRDGFRDAGRHGAFREMMSFWMRTHSDGRPVTYARNGDPQVADLPRRPGCVLAFRGQIIHWRFDEAHRV